MQWDSPIISNQFKQLLLSKKDKLNSGGRNQKDESELSDSGAATRNADVNANTKGTEEKE